jgi:hypothetical protein
MSIFFISIIASKAGRLPWRAYSQGLFRRIVVWANGLDSLAPRAEVPRASFISSLECQTALTLRIGPKGISGAVANRTLLFQPNREKEGLRVSA